MPQKPGVNSTSKRAGSFQAAKPLPPTSPPARGPLWRVPTMPASADVVLHWNEHGSLCRDPEFREPTGLQIFERADDERADDEDDDD